MKEKIRKKSRCGGRVRKRKKGNWRKSRSRIPRQRKGAVNFVEEKGQGEKTKKKAREHSQQGKVRGQRKKTIGKNNGQVLGHGGGGGKGGGCEKRAGGLQRRKEKNRKERVANVKLVPEQNVKRLPRKPWQRS